MNRDYTMEIAVHLTKNPNETLWNKYWSYHKNDLVLTDLAYSAIKLHENSNKPIDECLEKVIDYYKKYKKLIPDEYIKGE